jgi:UDP-N-acetylglucosamine transferase subunit ALG13
MIFVTVGASMGFGRLVEAVTRWRTRSPDTQVFIQGGPKFAPIFGCECVATLSAADHEYMMRSAELVVAHAGIRTILRAQALQRPLVVMPRQAVLGEHRSDHQVELARVLDTKRLARVAFTSGELLRALEQRESIQPPSRADLSGVAMYAG